MLRIKRIYIFLLIFAVFVPSMKIQAAYRDTQGKVHLKPGIYQTLDKLEKSKDDLAKEFTEGPSEWVKSGYYSYEFLDSQKKYITIRKIDPEAVQGRRLVIPKEIDGHQVLGVGLWTDWVVAGFEECYRMMERKKDITGLVPPEWLEIFGYDVCYSMVEQDLVDLTEIVLPEGLEFIGALSFYRYLSVKKISFPNSLVVIRTRALYDCPIGEMELPPGVYVENGALDGSGIDIGEGDDDNGGLPFHGCSPRKITMYSDSLVSFSNTWFADWGCAQLHIRYYEKDSYSLDLPGYIEKLYIDKKLMKFRLGMAYKNVSEEDGRREDYQVRKLIINGRNTKLELYKRKSDVMLFRSVKGLYTAKGAASIKGAKKYGIPSYWKTAGKAKEVKAKKKNGSYQANWKKIKTTVCKYYFSSNKDKWATKKTPVKTVYKVYGKKIKNGSYQLIKTTKKRSIKSKYKYIKAVPVREWE